MIMPIAKRSSNNKLQVLTANITFLVTALLFLTVGAWAQHKNFHIGILITEYVLLCVPVIAWGVWNKVSWQSHFRFKKPKGRDLIRLTLTGFLFIPFVGFLNAIISVWLVTYFKFTPPEIPTMTEWYGPIVTFFIVAVTPGLCEEFFFRGMVLGSYEKKYGLFTGAVMSAVLFGFFHFNPMNLLGPIFLGLMFSWVLQVTGSIWTAMYAHMVNNGVAVLFLYAFAGVDKKAAAADQAAAVQQLGGLYPVVMGIGLIFLGLFAASSLILALYLLKGLRKKHPKPADVIQIGTQHFVVTGLADEAVYLLNQTAEQNWLDLDGDTLQDQIIKTSAHKIFANRGSKYAKKHWHLPFEIKMTVFEWTPLALTGILYVGFVVLIFMSFMSTGV